MAVPIYPTFNGQPLFCSTQTDGSRYSEGVLYVPSYRPITQPIHFEGAIGDIALTHGWADLDWVFEGLISAYSNATFTSNIQAIQTVIQNYQTNPNTYYTLVDTFGTSYSNAQVRGMDFLGAPHVQQGGGYAVKVRITGVVQGDTQFEAT